MIPDDAINRLHESTSKVAQFCDELGVKQWEIVAEQGYRHLWSWKVGKSPWLQVEDPEESV